jgi:hypothetical protein
MNFPIKLITSWAHPNHSSPNTISISFGKTPGGRSDIYRYVLGISLRFNNKEYSIALCYRKPLRTDEYWLQIDPITRNPISLGACWAYYEGDKPTSGLWIKVRKIDD